MGKDSFTGKYINITRRIGFGISDQDRSDTGASIPHFEAFHATETCTVLRYYYILELTTIIADDIDIQEDSLPVFIG